MNGKTTLWGASALAVAMYMAPIGTAHGATCAQQFYLSASGNDSNNGTTPTTPWQNVSKVSSAKLPANSCVTLLSNVSGNLVLDGSNVTGPLTWDGGAFQLTATASGAGTQAVLLNNIPGGVNFMRTKVRPVPNGNTQYGVNSQGSTLSLIQMNDIQGFTLADGSNDASADIMLGGAGDTATNNIVSGNPNLNFRDDHGIRAAGYKGPVTITWNTITQIEGRTKGQGAGGGYSGNGIGIGWASPPCDQAQKCTITVERNLVKNTGGNNDQCGGPSNGLGYQVVSILNVGFNEFAFSRPFNPAKQTAAGGCDWDGWDFDGSNMFGHAYNNYTHDNFGFGIFGWAGDGGGLTGWGPNSYTNNYSKNDGVTALNGNFGYWGSNGFAVKNQNVVATMSGNYFELTTATAGVPVLAFSDTGTLGSGGAMTNNIFVIHDDNGLMMKCNGPNPMQAWTWTGNKWFGPKFTAGSNCGGNGPATFAAWQAAVKGGDAGGSFLPAASAPPPPALPQVGANNPTNPNNGGMPFPPTPPPVVACKPVTSKGTQVTTAGPAICMPSGDSYAMTTGGQITGNGTVLPESGNVTTLYTDGTAIWQQAGGGTVGWGPLWWEKVDGKIATAWTPTNGQTTSPIAPVTGIVVTGVTYTGTNTIASGLPAGAVLGSISVQTTGGAFTGTPSLPTGETNFALQGANLMTAKVLTGPAALSTVVTAAQPANGNVPASTKNVGVPVTVSPSNPAVTPAQQAAINQVAADIAKLNADFAADMAVYNKDWVIMKGLLGAQ